MASMAHPRRGVGWIAVLAVLLVTPSGVVAESATADGAAGPLAQPAAATATGIVPGSVNRTSINLAAEYNVTVRLNFATRAFRVDSLVTITNTSGVDSIASS